MIQFSYVLNATLEIEDDFVCRTTDFLAITNSEYQKTIEFSSSAHVKDYDEDLMKTGRPIAPPSWSSSSYY